MAAEVPYAITEYFGGFLHLYNHWIRYKSGSLLIIPFTILYPFKRTILRKCSSEVHINRSIWSFTKRLKGKDLGFYLWVVCKNRKSTCVYMIIRTITSFCLFPSALNTCIPRPLCCLPLYRFRLHPFPLLPSIGKTMLSLQNAQCTALINFFHSFIYSFFLSITFKWQPYIVKIFVDTLF